LGIGDWGLGIGPNPQSPVFFNNRIIKKFLNLINYFLIKVNYLICMKLIIFLGESMN